jgi:hypothetical protein
MKIPQPVENEAPAAMDTSVQPPAAPEPQVQPAQASFTTADMANLQSWAERVNQQLEQLATHQVVGQMATAITGDSTPSVPKISFKDIQLDHFYGNSNRDATFIYVDELSHLQSWLECSVGRMRDVGLPTKQHVPKLISSLRRPAERASRAKYGPFDKSTWDIDECHRGFRLCLIQRVFFQTSQQHALPIRTSSR